MNPNNQRISERSEEKLNTELYAESVMEKLRARFRSEGPIASLYKQAAKTHEKNVYLDCMNAIKCFDHNAWEFLLNQKPEKWSHAMYRKPTTVNLAIHYGGKLVNIGTPAVKYEGGSLTSIKDMPIENLTLDTLFEIGANLGYNFKKIYKKGARGPLVWKTIVEMLSHWCIENWLSESYCEEHLTCFFCR